MRFNRSWFQATTFFQSGVFICCAFAGDSYQESKPGNERLKSKVSEVVILNPERLSIFG